MIKTQNSKFKIKNYGKTISIIGVGLIGASLGLAFKRLKKYRVTGIGRNMQKLKYAKKCGAVDEINTSFSNGVKDADIVVLAVPVMTCPKIAEEIKPFLKENAVIFDVGSTKLGVTGLLTGLLGRNFVGAHPIAGSEKTGVKYANADLFKNTICVLTPVPQTEKKAVKIVKDLMTGIGTRIIKMSPSEHDKILAFTSHLPHITAVSLVKLLGPLENEKPLVRFLIGNGFKDTTRISAGSPEVWVDICKTNRENLIYECDEMTGNIAAIKKLLQKQDWETLFIEFDRAKKLRETISNGTITH
ncbi:MAG: prephenate dehydrogenase [bacterium]